MANLKQIRKRISSVKSTQKITRAMKMVAGARLTRAQQRIVALRPFAVQTAKVLANVTAAGEAEAEESGERAALGCARLSLGADGRGLAGHGGENLSAGRRVCNVAISLAKRTQGLCNLGIGGRKLGRVLEGVDGSR